MLVMNKRKKFGIRLESVYFIEDWQTYKTECDAVLFFCTSSKPSGLFRGMPFHTLHISLKDDEETLLKNMRKTTRRDIARAINNPELVTEYFTKPSQAQVHEFCVLYNQFATHKGISTADESYLMKLFEMGIISLMYIRDAQGNYLCGEADIIQPERCYGAYAFTMFRQYENKQVMGQANKLLYWISMQNAKKAGCEIYDMAGIANGKKGSVLDGIDDFKKGFGGEIVQENDFYKGYTFLGKLLVCFFKLTRKSLEHWD